jgi:hypothetical protein
MYTAAVHHHAMVDAEARKGGPCLKSLSLVGHGLALWSPKNILASTIVLVVCVIPTASTQVEDALRSLHERRMGSPGSQPQQEDAGGHASNSRSVSPSATNSLVSDSDPSVALSARSPDHSPECGPGQESLDESEIEADDEGSDRLASDYHVSSNSSSTNPSMPTPTAASGGRQPLSSAANSKGRLMDSSSRQVAEGLMTLAQHLVTGKNDVSPSLSPVGSTISIGSADCEELMNFEGDMNP